MDAFAFVVGGSRVDPVYFWYSMDFRELESLVPYYREAWEQTRLIVQALSGERIPMPWDKETEAELVEAQKQKIAAAKPHRIAAAKLIVINNAPLPEREAVEGKL